MSSVEYLPIWKKGATAAERLYELAQVAEKHPERFDKFVIVYVEKYADQAQKVEYLHYNCDTMELFGVLEAGKLEAYIQSRG